jgi:hypothetical protein
MDNIKIKPSQSQLNLIKKLIKRSSEIYQGTITKLKSGYLKDKNDIEIYVKLFFINNNFEWIPKIIFLNIMKRALGHYLSNPNLTSLSKSGLCLPFNIDNFSLCKKGIDFFSLGGLNGLAETRIFFLERSGSNTPMRKIGYYTTLYYSKGSQSLILKTERIRKQGPRVDVWSIKRTYRGSVYITIKEMQLLVKTSKVITAIRSRVIDGICDFYEATGKYPSWSKVKRDLDCIKTILKHRNTKTYEGYIKSAFYHTSIQALLKTKSYGKAEYWPVDLDRISLLIETPSTKLPFNTIQIPTIGKRRFNTSSSYTGNCIQETVKYPHVICFDLLRSDKDLLRGVVRFKVYPIDTKI